MKLTIMFLLALLTTNATAKELFPVGCKPIPVQEATVTLSVTSATVIMMHNLSDIDLWVTHPIADPSASAGFSSRLQSNNWSALALNRESFEISCIESKPGHEQQVPCANVLAVCQWTKVSIPKKLSGTFWAGEDMPLSELKAYIGRRGFVIPN